MTKPEDAQVQEGQQTGFRCSFGRDRAGSRHVVPHWLLQAGEEVGQGARQACSEGWGGSRHIRRGLPGLLEVTVQGFAESCPQTSTMTASGDSDPPCALFFSPGTCHRFRGQQPQQMHSGPRWLWLLSSSAGQCQSGIHFGESLCGIPLSMAQTRATFLRWPSSLTPGLPASTAATPGGRLGAFP